MHKEIFISHNICNKCNFIWHNFTGPELHCPNPNGCDSLYWKWVNYKEVKSNWCSVCNLKFGLRKIR